MQQDPERLHASSPAELLERMAAERAGEPFLLYRDQSGAQRVFALGKDASQLTIGRGPGNDLRIEWDESVSRVHAELIRLGQEWTVVDDGLSRNGSYVNAERLSGRRRLRDGDLVRIGETAVIYRAPAAHEHGSTAFANRLPATADLSPAKRRVLVALARPYQGGGGFSTPATNQQIATELFLSVEGVKTHLRGLFELFGVQHLPQNEKRATLVERAFLAGVITERDLRPE
ncbi:MAG TPA: FHA domain-containing protein [Solirubrobacteraceae bacterium]|nr:FHA domain-containing protein [Solirubrobacteraceae bacterium]